MSDWIKSTIGDVFDVVGGGTPSTEKAEYWKGPIPWITSADIDEHSRITPRKAISEKAVKDSATSKVPAGSVVVVTRVGLGKVGIAETDLCFSQDCQGLLFDQQSLEPKFVAHQLVGATKRFHEISRGTTINGVTKKQLLSTPFYVAPRSEQKRVVDKLEELLTDLEAGAAALERARANLKRYRAAVLKAAVEGRLTEKWRAAHPDIEPAEKLLERILAERRKKWEEAQLKKFAEKKQAPPKGWKDKYSEPVKPDVAELPKLPEGWCWASWSEIGLSQNGRPFPSKEYSDIGAKLLRPGNLYATGAVGWTQKNTKCLPESYALENPDLIVGGGELVMNLTAQSLKDEFLGRICITANDERCLLNQRLARLTPILISPQFILWLFKSAHFRKFVAGLNAGSLIQHMFTSQLEEFVLPLPPIEEQSAIVLETGRLLSICDAVEVQMNRDGYRSARLRQAILKRAFEGKLVPQDPKDEPAGELLARIRAERTDQVAAGRGRGKIRKKIRQKTRK